MARRSNPRLLVLVVGLMLGVVAACSSGPEEVPGPELPSGTQLGSWGDERNINESIQLVLGDQAGGTSGTVVSLEVVEARAGDPAALTMFSGVTPDSTPWYVSVAMRNRGPADLDVKREKGWFVEADDVLIPPTKVHGVLRECPSTGEAEVLEVAAEELNCLVFLVPAGQRPSRVHLVRHDGIETVSWRVRVAN